MPPSRSISCVTIAVTRLPMRARACWTRASSSATSGTTRFAASVGVDARRSATSSSSGRSASCPIALTTGVWQAAAVRTSASSLKASRFWKSPPPRATMITSTSGSASSSRIAAATSAAARSPCTAACRTRKTTDGQRSCALRSTSFSASLSLPVTRPMHAGRNGQRLLAVGVEEPLRRELPAQPLEPFEQIAESDVAHGQHLHRERAALDPELGLRQGDDVVALLELLAELGARRRPELEREGHIALEVFELAEHGAVALVPLGQLALDPDGAEPLDVALDLAGDDGDRPRLTRRWRLGRPSRGRRRAAQCPSRGGLKRGRRSRRQAT